MAVTITGSKYGILTLSAVGADTIIIATSTFNSGDFNIARMVGLYSGGSVFKGIAYVRRFISATSLELEARFIDPVTGVFATQAIGDQIAVSKNFSESIVAGIALSGNVITVTDNIVFGVGYGNPLDTCFFDESKKMLFTATSTGGQGAGNGCLLKINSGCVVFGHLQNWSTRSVYGGIDIYYDTPTFYLGCSPTGGISDFFCFGGDHECNNIVIWEGGRNLSVANSQVYMKVLFGLDALSNTDGGPWGGNAARQCLYDCDSVVSGVNGIGIRWGDGVFQGGSVKIAGAQCIGAIGSSISAGQVSNVAAPPGSYLVIADIKPGTSGGYGPTGLWDSASSNNTIVNFTNVITPIRSQARPGANTTFNWYWKARYTNSIVGSVLVLIRNDTSAIVDSGIADANGETVLTLLEQTQNGSGLVPPTTVDIFAWTYSAKAYGYEVVSGVIARSTYALGTAGTSNIVRFGGAVVQSVDAGITLSQAAANALTTLPTLDNVYDRTIAWSVLNVTNAQYPSLGAYMANAMGSTLDFGSRNIVIDATAGVAFAVNTGTNTVTIKAASLGVGTKFIKLLTSGTITFSNGAVPSATLVYQSSAGTSVPIVVNGTRNGTKVRVLRTDTNAELAIGNANATNFAARVTWTTDLPLKANTVYVNGLDAEAQAFALGTLTNLGATITVTQVPAAIYEENAIDGSTVTGLSLDAPNIEIDANEADHTMSVQEIYAWYLYTLMSDAGMRTVFGSLIPVNTSKYNVNVATANLKIHNTDVVNTLMITGGIIARSDGTSIRKGGSTATYGSVEMTPNEVYTIETGVSGLTPTEATQLASIVPIKDIIEADEVHTTTTVTKKLRGTSSVLLVKNFTGIPLISLQVTQ